MKKYIIGGSLVFLGVLLSFPLFSMSYYTMVRTSTPEFCASCHEIKPAVVAWRSSTHTNNAAGVVVDCMDCHLPAPQDTFEFFFCQDLSRDQRCGEAFSLVLNTTGERAREAAYAAFDNDSVPEMPSQSAVHADPAGCHAGPPFGGLRPSGV